MLFGVFEVLTPLRLDVLGASTLAIAAVFLVCTAVEALLSPVFGRLADRRGPYPVARLGLAACIVMALVLPLPESVWPFAIALVAACVAFGSPWVPASTLLSGGAERQGLGQGIAFGLWNLAWGGRPGDRLGRGRRDRRGDEGRRALPAAGGTLRTDARGRLSTPRPDPRSHACRQIVFRR